MTKLQILSLLPLFALYCFGWYIGWNDYKNGETTMLSLYITAHVVALVVIPPVIAFN